MQQTNLLEETNQLLAKVKVENKIKELKRAKRIYYYNLIKKWVIRIFLFVFIISALFFPIETGTLIGTWVHDFFGTIYKNILK